MTMGNTYVSVKVPLLEVSEKQIYPTGYGDCGYAYNRSSVTWNGDDSWDSSHVFNSPMLTRSHSLSLLNSRRKSEERAARRKRKQDYIKGRDLYRTECKARFNEYRKKFISDKFDAYDTAKLAWNSGTVSRNTLSNVRSINFDGSAGTGSLYGKAIVGSFNSFDELYDSLKPTWAYLNDPKYPPYQWVAQKLRPLTVRPINTLRIKKWCNAYTKQVNIDYDTYMLSSPIADGTRYISRLGHAKSWGIVSNVMVWDRESLEWSANDEIKLLNKLTDKIQKHEFHLMNFLVEADRTILMLTIAVRNLSKAIHEFKRGEFAQALYDLGFNAGSKKSMLKSTGEGILQFVYGWAPLFNDVKAAAEAVGALQFPKPDFEVRTSHSIVRRGESGWEHGFEKITKRYIAKLNVSPPPSLSQFLHMDDPIQGIWEWASFSYLVDWVLPIQLYLEAAHGIEVSNIAEMQANMAVTKTITPKGYIETNPETSYGYYPLDLTGTSEYTFTRWRVDDITVPKPTVKSLSDTLSAQHLMNALALLTNLLSDDKQSIIDSHLLSERLRGKRLPPKRKSKRPLPLVKPKGPKEQLTNYPTELADRNAVTKNPSVFSSRFSSRNSRALERERQYRIRKGYI